MTTARLENAFKQFVAIRETVVKKGVGLVLNELVKAVDLGLNELAEVIAESTVIVTNRSIVQIAGSDNRIYALCEDGTLWEMNSTGQWDEHPPIPAKEVKA